MGVVQSNRRPTLEAVPDNDDDVFNPKGHNVAEVVAYVGEHPDEAKRIIAAERRGKKRKGVLALG